MPDVDPYVNPTPNIVSPVPKGDGLYVFAWKQPKASSLFIDIVLGQKHKKTIFIPSTSGAPEKWNKMAKMPVLGHIYQLDTKAHMIWHIPKLKNP